jgi:hypothetical protein
LKELLIKNKINSKYIEGIFLYVRTVYEVKFYNKTVKPQKWELGITKELFLRIEILIFFVYQAVYTTMLNRCKVKFFRITFKLVHVEGKKR